ncbi:MAG: hypothetical protein JWO03_1451 [Bacteroidetes bacterium]|nr:hypothetical protein [Bacteroidota bacterium]
MKPLPILLLTFTLCAWRGSSMNMKEAIASKVVAVEVSGANWDSMPTTLRSGFSPKMEMTVSNLSAQPVQLDLDPGYMLEAAEPGYQAMLLSQVIDFKLKPNEKQRNYVYAMCTELHKSGPNSSLKYHVGSKASPALMQMAMYIASKKYLVHAAQEAVWSISDDMPIPSITDGDKHIQDDLQKQAASIKKVNLADLQKEYDRRKGAQLIECNGGRLDRNIPFNIPDSAMVSVGYYDYSGQLLKPIMKNTMLMQGKHSVRYDPFPVALAGKRYTVRMVKDGNVYREYNFRQ